MNVRSFDDLQSIMIDADMGLQAAPVPEPSTMKTIADLESILIQPTEVSKPESNDEAEGAGDDEDYDDESFDEASDLDESLDAMEATEDSKNNKTNSESATKNASSSEEDLNDYIARRNTIQAAQASKSGLGAKSVTPDSTPDCFIPEPSIPERSTVPMFGSNSNYKAAGPVMVNYDRTYDVSIGSPSASSKRNAAAKEDSDYTPTMSPGAERRGARELSLSTAGGKVGKAALSPRRASPRGTGSSGSSSRQPLTRSQSQSQSQRQNENENENQNQKQNHNYSTDSMRVRSAEIRHLARGVARPTLSAVRRVEESEVPGLAAFLKHRGGSGEGGGDADGDGFYADENENDKGNVGTIDGALERAGLDSEEVINALAGLMARASDRKEEEDKLRSLLNRRSRPLPTPASPDGGFSKAARPGRASKGERGPFGALDVETEPVRAYGMDNWDPDFHAALMSEETELSRQLQGQRSTEEALSAYADIRRRLASLEARARKSKTRSTVGGLSASDGDEEKWASSSYVKGRIPVQEGRGVEREGKVKVDVDDSREDAGLRAQEMSFMTAVSLEERVPGGSKLRIGTDKVQLMVRAQDVYANFLSDIVDLCKQRAAASSSVEDMAMHRVLAELVRKAFSGVRKIETVQTDMVTAAIETSLRTL